MFKTDQKNCVRLQQTQNKQKLRKIDPMEQELMVIDDDYLMSSPFRICSECGQNHSIRNNFEGVKTSLDTITEFLSKYSRIASKN